MSSSRRSVIVLLCAATTAAVAPHALAQAAGIAGTVRDPSGAFLPGALVEATDQKTGQTVATRSNGSGVYTLPALQPGLYTLRVSASGLATESIRDLYLDTAARLTRDVTLRLGSESETVQVDGAAEPINTVDATVSTVIDRRFVENLPLNGRSFQSLITLAPGVSVVPSAGVGSSGEISVNGQRTEANYYTIDGISANTGATVSTAGTPGAGFSGSTPQESALGTTQSIVSIDALEQFRASTSTYAAEYGRTPGGQFAFSTRSGTDHFHGTAFDYLRNDAFDARNTFDTTRLPERQNDFGGTLGGPLLPILARNRTFFFFSYEGLRLTNPVAAALYQVPSNDLRAAAPDGLKPFLAAFPVSSGPDLGGDQAGLANYTAGYSAPSRLDTTSVRIDHNLSDRFHLFGRYSDVPSQSASRQPSDLAQLNTTVRNVKTGVIGLDALFSSALSNSFRVGLTANDYRSDRTLDNFGGATPLDVSAAPGLGSGDWMTFFLFYGLYPYYLLEPQSNRQRQVNAVDTLTETLHRHTLRYGVDYRRLITSERLPPLWEVGFFSSADTIINNAPTGLYVYTQSINMKAQQHELSLFAEDEWRTTDRLSLSYGVRWDLNPPPTDVNGNTPYTADQVTDLATTVAAPRGTSLWHTTFHNFAPRVGFAYQLHRTPGQETVLRAGGGLFYDTGVALSTQGYYGIGTTGFANYTGTMDTAGNRTDAFPATLPQVQGTPVPTADPPYNAPIYAFDPNLRQPYTAQWNVAVEQALGSAQTLTLNYVASAGRSLLVQRFYHPESVGNTAFAQGKGLYVTDNDASSDYNSLQAKFERRLSHGLQILGSYTWAHAFDNATSNFTVFALRRSVSDYDIRHSFQAAASYDIPAPVHNPVLGYALGHWSLDTRFSARSALPVDVLQAQTIDSGSGASVQFHPDRVLDQPLYLYGSAYRGGRAINFNAFTPTANTAIDGSAGRNSARGFNAIQTDLTLRRDFPIHESIGLQFRAEAYNLLNHPIYGTVRNSLSDGASLFGQPSNTLNNQLGSLAALYQTGGPRSLQVALKLHF